MSKWNDYASDAAAERFLRDAAFDEGLTYHQFCDKYGIVDDALARQVRRHEVLFSDLGYDEAVALGLREPPDEGEGAPYRPPSDPLSRGTMRTVPQ